MQQILRQSVCRLLIVFDMDGTLTDSGGRVVKAMGSAFHMAGLDTPPDADIKATVGLQPVDMIPALTGDLSAETVRFMAEHYEQQMTALRLADPHTETSFPGAAEILRSLHQQGIPLGIATGKGRFDLDGALTLMGWHQYFTTLQPAEVGPGKPDPAQLHAAMLETGALPSETLMIGDTSFDMEMAKRAGVIGIGVSWGSHSHERLSDAGADQIVDTFEALNAVIHERTTLIVAHL